MKIDTLNIKKFDLSDEHVAKSARSRNEPKSSRALSVRSITSDYSDIESRIGKDLLLLGLSYKELDQRCMDIFYSGESAPIPFKPDKDIKIDKKLVDLIKELNVRVPIVHIKGSQYLIGLNKCLCEIRGNIVMIRVGGGYESFKSYISKNYKYFERMLAIMMFKSDYTIEKVVECLI